MQLVVVDSVEMGDLVNEGHVNLVFQILEIARDGEQRLAVQDDAVWQLPETIVVPASEVDAVVEAEEI